MTVSSPSKPGAAAGLTLDPGLRQVLLLGALILVMIGGWFVVCGYGVIPTLEQAAKTRWAEVQSKSRQRSEVIARLATIAAPARDQQLHGAVAAAQAVAAAADRNDALPADPVAMLQFERAQEDVSAALGRLLALAGQDSGLASNPDFTAARAQLVDLDKSITLARHGYVEYSRRYNIALRAFPTLFWALVNRNQPLIEFGLAIPAAPRP